MIKKIIFTILIVIYANLGFASSTENMQLNNANDYLKILPGDFVFGEESAPVTVIEYSNFSCPYCAYFHTNFIKEIKNKYIDTGKIKWVTRLYVSDGASLTGSILARCFGDDNKYYAIVDLLFLKQDKWAFSKDSKEFLYNIAILSGMGDIEYHQCINNKNIEEYLLNQRMIAQKILKVSGTPTFFIDGKEERFRDLTSFEKILNSYNK